MERFTLTSKSDSLFDSYRSAYKLRVSYDMIIARVLQHLLLAMTQRYMALKRKDIHTICSLFAIGSRIFNIFLSINIETSIRKHENHRFD